MMLPSIEEIKNTISDPKNILLDELKGFSPIPGILGPEQYPGGYSIVFPFSNGKEKKALRIWHKEIPHIKRRTAQISSYLSANSQLEYFIDYEYVCNAVRFDSGIMLDAVLMDWCDGLTLKDYIDNLIHSHTNSKSKTDDILELAKSFFFLFSDLHKAHISHGDLQHGNIMITDDKKIKLIDYDSLFVPTMGDKVTQVTSGLSGYQHPSRSSLAYATEKNDYFSEMIIITSLVYLNQDISVWDDLSVMEDDYSLLFNVKDYSDFKKSKVYKRGADKSSSLKLLLDEIQHALDNPNIETLRPIEEIINSAGFTWNVHSIGNYCITCGAPQNIGDKYCTLCGTKLIYFL